MADKFERAYHILKRYHRFLVESLAGDVIDRKDDFAEPGVATKCDELTEGYSRRLAAAEHCLASLANRPVEIKVEQFDCAKADIAKRIEDWLSTREAIVIRHVQVLLDGGTCTCIIIYSQPIERRSNSDA